MSDRTTIDHLMKIAKAIDRGEIPPYQHENLYTAGAFDLIVFNSQDKGALFDILRDICAEYDSIKGNEKDIAGFIYLLECAARATGTTEMPPGMDRIIRENATKSGTLREWYRLRG